MNEHPLSTNQWDWLLLLERDFTLSRQRYLESVKRFENVRQVYLALRHHAEDQEGFAYLDDIRAHKLTSGTDAASRGTDVTEAQWAQVAPLLSLDSGKGRPYTDTRRTLNGVLYVLRTHCGWNHLLPCYGSHVTCWRRYQRWQSKGVWKQVEQLLELTPLTN